VGLSLDKADKSVLGTAAKVVLTKESTTIVGDGSTQEEVTKRVAQIKNLIEVCHFHFLYFSLNSIALQGSISPCLVLGLDWNFVSYKNVVLLVYSFIVSMSFVWQS
jgi:hypothetical protein